MGDVNHRRLQTLVQTGNLDTHLHAQEGIEVRQRLVEQEHLRLAHHSTADGDALTLTTGEVFGLTLQQLIELQDARGFVHSAGDFWLFLFGELQAKAHVFRHAHVRVQGIALEHHADRALHRRQVVNALVADVQIAGGDVLQPRDQAQ